MLATRPLEELKKSRQQQLAAISEKHSKDKNGNGEDIKASQLLKQAEDDDLLAPCSAINRPESRASRRGNAAS